MTLFKRFSFVFIFVAINSYALEAEINSWNGTYIGAHVGAGSGTISQSFSDQSTVKQQVFPGVALVPSSVGVSTLTSVGAGFRDGNSTGSHLDVFVGYTYHPQASSVLVGGQLEGTLFNNLTMKASGIRTGQIEQATTTLVQSTNNLYRTNSISEMSMDLQSMVSMVGRAGVLVKHNTLLYGLLGATEGNFLTLDTPVAEGLSSNPTSIPTVSTTSLSVIPLQGATGNQRSQWKLGMTAGGGVEYQLTQHWSLLGEYRYLRFSFNQRSSIDSSFNTTNQLTQELSGTANRSGSQTTHSTLNYNLGQVGIVYRI